MKRTILISLAVGFVISLVTVVLEVVGVHTRIQLAAFVLSIPLMPGLLFFGAVARGSGMGNGGMALGLYASQVLSGTVVYGAVVFLVMRLWRRRGPRTPSGGAPILRKNSAGR